MRAASQRDRATAAVRDEVAAEYRVRLSDRGAPLTERELNQRFDDRVLRRAFVLRFAERFGRSERDRLLDRALDRKSTRLNSSH